MAFFGLTPKDIVPPGIGAGSALVVWLLSHKRETTKDRREATAAEHVAEIEDGGKLRSELWARILTLEKKFEEKDGQHEECERRYQKLEFEMKLLTAAVGRTEAKADSAAAAVVELQNGGQRGEAH